jgi:hypothetical protein
MRIKKVVGWSVKMVLPPSQSKKVDLPEIHTEEK